MNVKAPAPSRCRKFSNLRQKSKKQFLLHPPERILEFRGAFCHTILQNGSTCVHYYI